MFNKNLLNYIVAYLDLKEILDLSLVNKKLSLLLDNKNNDKINNLWREECNKTFYTDENNLTILEEINIKDKGIKFDWRQIYKQFVIYKQSISNEISNDIYNMLNIHCYLPKLRKQISDIESEFSSEHQKHFYDIIKEENQIYLYYNLYFENEDKNKKLMKPNLPFGNYILNFQNLSYQIKENKIDLIVLEKIFNYSKIEINSNQISSEPLKFILWLEELISLYCKLHLGYIYKFENENDNCRFLNEFISRHNSLIDVALYLNDKYEHINIIINYLYTLLHGVKICNGKFSLYTMILSIWYKEVYLKLENEINEKLSYVIDNMLDELNASDYDLTADSTINYISDDEEENKDNKTLIENIGNCLLDYSIGEFNSNYIKHTQLNINEHYENYEKILGEKISNYITNKVKYGEDFSNLKNLISFQETNDLVFSLDYEKKLKVIPRTQLYLMNMTIFSIKNLIVDELKENYIRFIQNYNELNNEMEIELDSKNENVKKELNNIKNYLIMISKKYNLKEEKIGMLVNKFMRKDGKKIIDLACKISLFYYEEIKKYSESNKSIETFLEKRINWICTLNESSKNENKESHKIAYINYENNNVILNH